MMMVEVVYYVAVSLDGYIATEDGGVEWLSEFSAGGDDYGYEDFYSSIDAVLFGSTTYEQSLRFGEWPLAGKPSWVFTSRQLTADRDDIIITSKTPSEVLEEIAAQNHKRVWLIGGGKLASSFREHGLITEYIVTIIPIILGKGILLFAPASATEKLTLVESREFPNGLIQLRYLRNAL